MEEKFMKKNQILAFDFGASSGRAMLSRLENGKLVIEEIHRFANDPVQVGGHLYWDVLRLFHEIKQGILKANAAGGFDSIGIDTWGVDFGLLDEHGELLGNPYNYRDIRTEGMQEEFYKTMSAETLYAETGIQQVDINTVYQLQYMVKYRKETMAQAKTFLMIPDLFAYFLTGAKRVEYSNASTTGLLDPTTKQWNEKVLSALGIRKDLFGELIKPGEIYGNLLPEICEELHCDSVPVVAVASHDTASAVASVPTQEKDYAYISCGTWSLFGTIIDIPILSEESRQISFTNEGASDGKIRYLKNIMGLWLIQQSRQEWKRQGLDVSFDEMERAAKDAEPFRCFIDPDAKDFIAPGNMPKRVQEFCKRTGQYVPQTMGEILRCIYQSLAFKYRYAVEGLEKLVGHNLPVIHMIGGGIKDQLLCSMAADYCQKTVKAGPVEATVTGNAVVQMMAFDQIQDLNAARAIIADSFPVKTYLPASDLDLTVPYTEFLKYIGS